ncbi:hypothetical protein M433DRAFT_156460 [Acidomyces richmondensis BFW]|nr:MAG: hypothetical protein FE78DRAFT_89284 [Acidomyces sp. 'richmondensis']KYG43655.1 hypothetical protein M433DRAFT_156460 [Acidomyces richmondensis BFW]
MKGGLAASILALPATLRSTVFLTGVYFLPLHHHHHDNHHHPHPQDNPQLQSYTTMATPEGPATVGGKAMLARHRRSETQTSTAERGGHFPLSYRDGLAQWWANLTPAVTEHRVLSYVPYLRQNPPTHTQTGNAPAADLEHEVSGKIEEDDVTRTTDTKADPYGPRRWHSQMVQLDGKGRFINEFSVERLEDGEPASSTDHKDNNNNKNGNVHHLVMLHGYGAGLAFFYKNFDALSRPSRWHLHALDLLGMGRSSRPPFRIRAKDRAGKIAEAEGWFVDALEEWRVKRGIDRMTLLGHSLGGYMAVCYALKYPGRCEKLILASPVGIPEDPYAVADEPPTQPSNDGGAVTADLRDETSSSLPPRKPLPKWLTTLWDANISPFSIVRLSGPLGPRLVSGWTSRRFSHLPPAEAQALHDYSYSLFRQRGSGEYALAYVLAPGAFARSPLVRRIGGVGRGWYTAPSPDGGEVQQKETGIPVVFLYGENDWMDVAGGWQAEQRLKAAQRTAVEEAPEDERKRENGDVKVKIVKGAGHHVYLDGWEEFNEMVRMEMKDVEDREERLRGC